MTFPYPYLRNLTVGELEELVSDGLSDIDTARRVCRWCYGMDDEQITALDAGVMMGMVKNAFERIGAAID